MTTRRYDKPLDLNDKIRSGLNSSYTDDPRLARYERGSWGYVSRLRSAMAGLPEHMLATVLEALGNSAHLAMHQLDPADPADSSSRALLLELERVATDAAEIRLDECRRCNAHVAMECRCIPCAGCFGASVGCASCARGVVAPEPDEPVSVEGLAGVEAEAADAVASAPA